MSAYRFSFGGGRGIVHLSDIYRFKGYTFEWHRYCGPFLLNKDMEPRKIQPGEKNRFWPVLDEWQKMTNEQKEETRIYG